MIPLAAKFEVEILDIMSLLEVTAKEKVVIREPFSDQIDFKIHGIGEWQDVEKRELAKMILFNKENLDAVYFALPNGDMYMVEPYEYQKNLVSTNFAHRDWYKGLLNTQSTYVSEYFVAQGKREPTFAIVTPVKSRNGEFIGMWGALVDLDKWQDQFDEINFVQNEDAYLIDHNGNRVIGANHEVFGTSFYLNLESVNRALSGNSGNIVEMINGVSSFVTYTPVTVGSHTWALIVVEPYSDVFAQINSIRMSYIAIVIAMSAATAVALYRLKIDSGKINLPQLKQIEDEPQSNQNNIPRFGKNILLILILLFMTFVTIVLSIQENQIVENSTIASGSFVIENLRGDTVDTWVNWNIPEGDTFHIHVVNSPELTTHRMQVISDAIYSKETITLDDSLLHKGPVGSTSTYYKGWLGAMESVADINTKFALPLHFHSTVTDRGEGHIVIRLTNLKNADGYAAYTKSIVDEENHQILKSVITIYEIDKLSDEQLATIIRHEMGHGLGLGHSTAPEDLMAPEITTPYPYISECDIAALVDLYNGKQQSKIICEK